MAAAALMAERLEVRLHGEPAGWITRGSRRDRIEFEWADGYTPGLVTLTESFGAVRPKAPSAEASSFFGGMRLRAASASGSPSVAASDGDLGSDDQSRPMLAGHQPKLLLAVSTGHSFASADRHEVEVIEGWLRLPGRGGAGRSTAGTSVLPHAGTAAQGRCQGRASRFLPTARAHVPARTGGPGPQRP